MLLRPEPQDAGSILGEMLEFLVRPLRSALGATEHDAVAPFQSTEHEIAAAADAMRRVSDSVERHIEVVEGLARSVGPLTDSVNQLTATMNDLVVLLAPMAKVEHEAAAVERDVTTVRRLFGSHRHHKTTDTPPEGPE
jgi:ABC-type transporter Mla subunit MlaD